jgi:hypothetical protein
LTGFYHQVINNVAADNLSPLCSTDMDGDASPAAVLPYAPRFHDTNPNGSNGPHSIDDWVGPDSNGNIMYRQSGYSDRTPINPRGFRCMFAPDSLGNLSVRRSGTPPPPKLNCDYLSTPQYPDDCSNNPPAAGPPRDEL